MLAKRPPLPAALPNISPLTSIAYNRRVTIQSPSTPNPPRLLTCRSHLQREADDNDFTVLSSTDDQTVSTTTATPSRNRGITAGFDKLKAHKLKLLATQGRKRVKEECETGLGSEEGIRDERDVMVEDRDGLESASDFRGWGGDRSRRTQSSTFEGRRGKHKFATGDDDFFSSKSFKEIGCSDSMVESLKRHLFLRPSHIQALAFGPVIEGKSCVIADQSGSGKTLAYLTPIIQRIRQDEVEGHDKCLPRCPRVVVLVPTAELASQVLSNCRSMAKLGVPFRSMVATGGFRQRTQLENLDQGVDVLISTPGRFSFLFKEGFVQLTNLKCVVLDEVDIMFNDEGFEVILQSLINFSPAKAQYLFVTGTLPVDVYNKLVEVFPDCKVIMGPSMHRTSPKLKEVLVDCSGEDGSEKTPETAFSNKKIALLQLVESSSVSKTIVFCNKIETCRKVENALKRFDRKGRKVQVLPFHAAVAQESRVANMKEFMSYSSQSNEESKFLVCTDRASRGIDFIGVDHVVLFDFPRDPSEYVRRVGRTARGAGGKGTAYIFVVGKQVRLAQKIIERNQKGHPLHDVPSAYELMG